LEKLPIQSISLKIKEVGKVDTASAEIKEREAREDEDARLEELKDVTKKRVKKMRGKLKVGRVQETKQNLQHMAIREKNKLALLKDFKRAKL
jgi:hypothetical protein